MNRTLAGPSSLELARNCLLESVYYLKLHSFERTVRRWIREGHVHPDERLSMDRSVDRSPFSRRHLPQCNTKLVALHWCASPCLN